MKREDGHAGGCLKWRESNLLHIMFYYPLNFLYLEGIWSLLVGGRQVVSLCPDVGEGVVKTWGRVLPGGIVHISLIRAFFNNLSIIRKFSLVWLRECLNVFSDDKKILTVNCCLDLYFYSLSCWLHILICLVLVRISEKVNFKRCLVVCQEVNGVRVFS